VVSWHCFAVLTIHVTGTAFIFQFSSTPSFCTSLRQENGSCDQRGLGFNCRCGPAISFSDVVLGVDAWLIPGSTHPGRPSRSCSLSWPGCQWRTIGSGPGLGSSRLVPVAVSDFIFVAIARRPGWLGLGPAGGHRLFRRPWSAHCLRAPDGFRRILAAGLTAISVRNPFSSSVGTSVCFRSPA